MVKNPRKKIPEEKYCIHIHPEDHPTRAREHCLAIRMKRSSYCYFHQPNQERVMLQLQSAREMRDRPPNERHGFYSTTQKECDNCALMYKCEYYLAGKKVCDYQIKPKFDLSSIEKIQEQTEQLLSTEMARYLKLEPFFMSDSSNTELFEVGSRIAKRITSMVKDYSAIMATFNKQKKTFGWDAILKSKKSYDPEENR